MDPKAIGEAVGSAVTFALSSPACLFAVGLAAGNTQRLVYSLLLGIYKVPALRALIFGNPEKAKARLAALVQEVDDDMDAIAKQQAAASQAAVPAVPKA